jgi:hypothetical protein
VFNDSCLNGLGTEEEVELQYLGWRLQAKALTEGCPSLVFQSSGCVVAYRSATRLLLIGKHGAGFVRKTLEFWDDLTFDESEANTCRRNWPQNRVSSRDFDPMAQRLR